MSDKLKALINSLPDAPFKDALTQEILAMECESRRLEREVARLELKADEVFQLRVEAGAIRLGGE